MSKKKSGVFLALAILSINLLSMAGASASSAIAAIAKSFPNEPIAKIQMLGVIERAGQILSTILFAYFGYRVSKKHLGLTAIAIIAVFGLMPVVFNKSLNMILFCIIMVGFGVGFLSTTVQTLLQQNFEGEERAKYMSWAMGFMTISFVLFTSLGGWLGNKNWHNLFWVYTIAIIVFIIVAIFVPNDVAIINNKDSIKGQPNSKGLYRKILRDVPALTWALIAVTFVTNFANALMTTNMSILIAQRVAGGTFYTSTIMSAGSIGGLIAAFAISYIRKVTKSETIAIGFIIAGIALVLIPNMHNLTSFIIISVFSSIGVLMANATLPYDLSVVSGKHGYTFIIAINHFVSSITGLLSPLIISAFRIKPGAISFYVAGAVLVITSILLLVFRVGRKVENYSSSNE